jgi:SDR family mycofactocin-dependent oxidoreductase
MGRVQDKVVVITGAGVGQGRSHAVQLAKEGADIVAVDVCRQVSDKVPYAYATEADLEETRKLVENEGRRCLTVIADVRDSAAMKDAAAQGVREFDRIDAVCANAGILILYPEGSLTITPDSWDLVIETNLKGAWNTIQATAPHLINAGGGSIVIASSVAGFRGQVPFADYVATKHGVIGLMRAYANELAPHRIRVNTVNPTGVFTAMGMNPNIAVAAEKNPLLLQGAMNLLPDLDAPTDQPYAPIPGLQPIEVSKAVLFLISDDARYITGVSLPVDAGNLNLP